MDLTTLERLPMWIGGKAVAATTSRYGEVTNPATGEVIRQVPFCNEADIDTAVQAAPRRSPRGARRRRCAARASSCAIAS